MTKNSENGGGHRHLRARVYTADFVESLTMLNGFNKHRPLSTIEFEQQLDYLSQWMEKWSDQVVS